MDTFIDFLIDLVVEAAAGFVDLFVNKIFKRKKGYIDLNVNPEKGSK